MSGFRQKMLRQCKLCFWDNCKSICTTKCFQSWRFHVPGQLQPYKICRGTFVDAVKEAENIPRFTEGSTIQSQNGLFVARNNYQSLSHFSSLKNEI